MAASGGRHPSDADRAREALPALRDLLAALRAGDAAGAAGLLRDDVAWLAPDATAHGPDAARERLAAVSARADEWAPPQQHGARAALRWRGSGERGALVVEVRRGRVIVVVEA